MAKAARAGRVAPQRRDVNINLRASAQVRATIDRAAELVGKSRSEFMLDSARQKAEDVLLDQRLFILDDDKYRAFLSILDARPKQHAELKKLLSGKAPWAK